MVFQAAIQNICPKYSPPESMHSWAIHITDCSHSFKGPGAVANCIKLLKATCYVMHHQFNIQQLYALPTLYLCVLCLSENKQRLMPLTA